MKKIHECISSSIIDTVWSHVGKTHTCISWYICGNFKETYKLTEKDLEGDSPQINSDYLYYGLFRISLICLMPCFYKELYTNNKK